MLEAVSDAVQVFEIDGVGYVKRLELIAGDVQFLDERNCRNRHFAESVAVKSENLYLGAVCDGEFRNPIASCVYFYQGRVARKIECCEFVAADLHLFELREVGEIELTCEMFVFPVDGGHMAVGDFYTRNRCHGTCISEGCSVSGFLHCRLIEECLQGFCFSLVQILGHGTA